MSQTADVLALLKARGEQGLTALDALDTVGSFRLAARIADLKAEGIGIRTEMVVTESGARIARYVLDGTPRRAFDWPIGKPRLCPGCREMHCAGQSCAIKAGQPA